MDGALPSCPLYSFTAWCIGITVASGKIFNIKKNRLLKANNQINPNLLSTVNSGGTLVEAIWYKPEGHRLVPDEVIGFFN
jgi:hypothetical protein